MRVRTIEFELKSRDDEFIVVPVGDVHLGHAATDEVRLGNTFDYIAKTPNAHWIGMGDYGDFVSRSDKRRFSVGALAPWIELGHVTDVVRVQRDRFLSMSKPVAKKCLGFVEGNHEREVAKHYDRDVYAEMVEALNEAGQHANTLKLGYTGWINLVFRREVGGPSTRKGGTSTIQIKVHHGYGGGKSAGGKATNLQRLLHTCSADIVIVGHTHDVRWQPEGYEEFSRGKVIHTTRHGIVSGTYLRSTLPDGSPTYAEEAQYPPLGLADIKLVLRPGLETTARRIEIVATSV